MMVGNAEYQCSCVRYISQDNVALIVGLTVGLALLLFIIIAITNIALRNKHQGKLNYDFGRGKVSGDREDMWIGQYSRQFPDDYIPLSERGQVFGYQTTIDQDVEENQYSRQFPGDYVTFSEQGKMSGDGYQTTIEPDVKENQYSRQLPDDSAQTPEHEKTSGDTCESVIEQDVEKNQYSRQLPDDPVQPSEQGKTLSLIHI